MRDGRVSDRQGANAAPCTPRKGFHPLTHFAIELVGFLAAAPASALGKRTQKAPSLRELAASLLAD